MEKWDISDSEILELEEKLLPKGCSFAEDAKAVIRCWESKDVSACPGSGKTTVLLAKLKILADKMPFANGSGVCVLSHTNVAVNEIKDRLSDCAEKLMSYPNYIGTIQSFVDKYITMPYLKRTYGNSVQPVDDNIYAEHLSRIINSKEFTALKYFIDRQFEIYSDKFQNDRYIFISNLFLDKSGNLFLQLQNAKKLAGKDSKSAKQFSKAKQNLLVLDGIMKYKDTYSYAQAAIASFNDEYINLFSNRFKYVFIDEYQDCDNDQKAILTHLFNPANCFVMHIGDPDQAIYSSHKDNVTDWTPSAGFLSIESSCRFSQEIANILTPLKKDKSFITANDGNCGIRPVLIVYNDQSIKNVLNQFIVQIKSKGLLDPNGVYTAIGYVGKKSISGLRIGSYWEKYENENSAKRMINYWEYIDEICHALGQGKLYQVEGITRKLLCRISHFANIPDSENAKEFSPYNIDKTLHQKYWNTYSERVIELTKLQDTNRSNVDCIIHDLLDALFADKGENSETIFPKLPTWFIEQPAPVEPILSSQNVYTDPIGECKVRICTIHSVKGQTHDATLYLETTRSGGSDLGRILWCYGIGKCGDSSLFDYSRKLAYVGFSRPRKLLCVAMCEETFNKCKKSIGQEKWEIVDIR